MHFPSILTGAPIYLRLCRNPIAAPVWHLIRPRTMRSLSEFKLRLSLGVKWSTTRHQPFASFLWQASGQDRFSGNRRRCSHRIQQQSDKYASGSSHSRVWRVLDGLWWSWRSEMAGTENIESLINFSKKEKTRVRSQPCATYPAKAKPPCCGWFCYYIIML